MLGSSLQSVAAYPDIDGPVSGVVGVIIYLATDHCGRQLRICDHILDAAFLGFVIGVTGVLPR